MKIIGNVEIMVKWMSMESITVRNQSYFCTFIIAHTKFRKMYVYFISLSVASNFFYSK